MIMVLGPRKKKVEAMAEARAAKDAAKIEAGGHIRDRGDSAPIDEAAAAQTFAVDAGAVEATGQNTAEQ
jgi:translation initiation factor IF-3